MKSLRPFAFNLLVKGIERKSMIEKENVQILFDEDNFTRMLFHHEVT